MSGFVMSNWNYRSEIDGLRAIAIVLVLLFHADLGFEGGFIGVDIFFVISGFLITGLILNKQRKNEFRLSEFWTRRIRRILPASILMVALTLAYGYVIFMPWDFVKLSRIVFYHQCLVANVYLWLHSGYFETSTELNPLLHTWSLAVEEQFYLFYPFLLIWLGRFRESNRFRVLSVICLISLVGSEYVVRVDPKTAFFLLPTRAWEMLLGGLISFLPELKSRSRKFIEIVSVSAIIGLLLCGWNYHEQMAFPGFVAAVPCLLTALFIYLNSGYLTWMGRLMSTKPLVFTGLISYSLYLAHWHFCDMNTD